jgi:hypothetical protein
LVVHDDDDDDDARKRNPGPDTKQGGANKHEISNKAAANKHGARAQTKAGRAARESTSGLTDWVVPVQAAL